MLDGVGAAVRACRTRTGMLCGVRRGGPAVARAPARTPSGRLSRCADGARVVLHAVGLTRPRSRCSWAATGAGSRGSRWRSRTSSARLGGVGHPGRIWSSEWFSSTKTSSFVTGGGVRAAAPALRLRRRGVRDERDADGQQRGQGRGERMRPVSAACPCVSREHAAHTQASRMSGEQDLGRLLRDDASRAATTGPSCSPPSTPCPRAPTRSSACASRRESPWCSPRRGRPAAAALRVRRRDGDAHVHSALDAVGLTAAVAGAPGTGSAATWSPATSTTTCSCRSSEAGTSSPLLEALAARSAGSVTPRRRESPRSGPAVERLAERLQPRVLDGGLRAARTPSAVRCTGSAGRDTPSARRALEVGGLHGRVQGRPSSPSGTSSPRVAPDGGLSAADRVAAMCTAFVVHECPRSCPGRPGRRSARRSCPVTGCSCVSPAPRPSSCDAQCSPVVLVSVGRTGRMKRAEAKNPGVHGRAADGAWFRGPARRLREALR